jgi:hypothetical protein
MQAVMVIFIQAWSDLAFKEPRAAICHFQIEYQLSIKGNSVVSIESY